MNGITEIVVIAIGFFLVFHFAEVSYKLNRIEEKIEKLIERGKTE